jgi:spermidine synthase
VKIPLWKIWLSHFFSINLEKRKSQYSGNLEIVLSRGRVALCTDNAMYSFEDLYINFRETFEKINLDEYRIDKVLILGAGLLSVPYILEKIHKKNFKANAVDIDPEVLNLAAKYALPKLTSDIALICADATDFVKNETQKYGLIIVDIFIDNKVPSEFETSGFLENLKKLMSDNAILLYNRMAENEQSLKKTEMFYNQVFKKVFNNAEILTLKANRMLKAVV